MEILEISVAHVKLEDYSRNNCLENIENVKIFRKSSNIKHS